MLNTSKLSRVNLILIKAVQGKFTGAIGSTFGDFVFGYASLRQKQPPSREAAFCHSSGISSRARA